MSQPFGSWPAIPGTDPLRPLRTSLPWGKPLITIDGWDPMLQIVTANRITGDNVTGTNNWIASFVGFGSDTGLGPALAFSTSRSRHSQSPTVVSNGDNFGALRFYGADGYTYIQGAAFLAESDGTPSSSSMPGRLTFFTNPSGTPNVTERLRIDSGGAVVIGGVAAQLSAAISNLSPTLQLQGTSQTTSTQSITRWQNNALVGRLEFLKSRGAAVGTHAIVAVNENLGTVLFGGDDGTAFQMASAVQGFCDGTPSSTSMPGGLQFLTTQSSAGNAASSTERMRIDSGGNITTGGFSAQSTFGYVSQFQMINQAQPGNTLSTPVFTMFAFNNALGGAEIDFHHSRNATVGNHTALSSGDRLGALGFCGSDGVQFRNGVAIIATAEVAWSSGSSPGTIQFLTTTSGSTSGTERLRIDNQGRLFSITGASPIASVFDGSGHTAHYQFVNGSGGIAPSAMVLFRFENASNGPAYEFCKSRNATIGSHTVINAGDNLGHIIFNGSDGTSFQTAAVISAQADAAATSANVPGRISFYTAASGAGTNASTERLRIDKDGRLVTGAVASQSAGFGDVPGLQLNSSSTSLNGMLGIYSWSNNTSNPNLYFLKSRGGSVGTFTAVSNGDTIGGIGFAISTAINASNLGAAIYAFADAASTSGSVPARLSLQTTTSGGTGTTERLRIDAAGACFFPSLGTTASAANAVLNNTSSPVNSLLRSTSSIRYKADIAPVEHSRLAAVAAVRPVEFTSIASADSGDDTRFVGFIAEDVAQADPALVFRDSEGRPDGVMYDRVLLMQVEELRQRVVQLENELRETRH